MLLFSVLGEWLLAELGVLEEIRATGATLPGEESGEGCCPAQTAPTREQGPPNPTPEMWGRKKGWRQE